jgi:hypothetical protein
MQITGLAIPDLKPRDGIVNQRNSPPPSSETTSSQTDKSEAQNSTQTASREIASDDLTEHRQLQKLRNIDREVRAHEQAHLSAAGQYATSGASFSYQKGPDGRLYAVSGEVGIDTSAIPGDPQATLQKAQAVVQAALAPANPSAQDRRVAAQATAMAQQARVEIATRQETRESGQYLDAFA